MTPLPVDSAVLFDFWACPRPLTHKWGSGQVWDRIVKAFGAPDVAFGKTDGIPHGVLAVDINAGYDWEHFKPTRNAYDWRRLPYPDNHFGFGYWDPPYDKLYKQEGMEIWRTVRRLAILHTHIFPRKWLANAVREAMVAVTMGPMKQIRCLQVFRKEST